MSRDSLNIMIGGEAGQGLVTIGQVLCKCLVKSGYHILVTQDYMSRVRGGHNTFTIRAATRELDTPTEGVDLLIALNQETLDLHTGQLNPGAVVVAGQELSCQEGRCLSVPYKELAEGAHLNTIALGVAAGLLSLDQNLVADTLTAALGKKKDDKVVEANREGLKKSFDWLGGQEAECGVLAQPSEAPARMVLGGNQAIALGALAAGLKFLAFYPMTPSTAIALTVIAHADDMGVVYEQAEDEIAAINMALGASYAGAPAMVCTSGGGYALMTEGVSLAGMTETPMVIAIAMRPGPATGLPTRTEQGDLLFALHGGHGEFPRAILAPGDVKQCFEAGYHALHLAEKYQGPVFILTDQFLADSLRALEPFGLEGREAVRPGGQGEQGEDYKRYQITPDGISPRRLPGMGPELVVADSDEHTEQGHITEDLELRVRMNHKRLQKEKGLRSETIAPAFSGPEEPETLLVSWGSSQGPVAAAARRLRDEGQSVGSCHFSQVWPLDPEQFAGRMGLAGQVVVIEGNATGQFAGLLKKEAGISPQRLIGRCDGLNLTPEYILRQLAN
ncbi:MAG: 2-oxoacid:acceptor oxidoreductase subunit alpha [Desulfarculaceae bacterium]|nr:2-oxoacid:acceptor oxidoreductase subunit alpha [Desulfarculaceae bacterium]MCF8071372.1 2-oxoacid:acceptor oxidoreductase subunit alpha [Desulfarculaceae bacterium]MCF8101697.1 2-oxoacid:acceptor oxidoreductase subunit alpha [Desulfarculaceae bacterium]MCF8116694.1 2-oxoacid:acceptor oxidoreductase subunit alpha [Desulfarculaceae bacterium]